MAYAKLTLDHYDATMKILNRLAKVDSTMDFGNGISLVTALAAAEKEKKAYISKNDALDVADLRGIEANAAAKELDDIMVRIKNLYGIIKGKDSDEYVFAGGIRQSEVIEKQQTTRKENQKTEEEKKKKQ